MSRKVFSAVKMGAPDAILGLTDAFRKSSNVRKVNLGVGAYRDASGNPVVLPSVRDAISRINGDVSLNHEYAPIDGVPEFVSAAQKLMFGSCSASMNEKRTRSVQCLSGTGSLRVGAEFLMRHSGVTKSVYLSNPTWGNHAPLFRASGFNVFTYDYYNAAKKGLDFEKMCESLQSAERGAVVVLHACAHNPTGFDPSMDQWLTIRDILRQRELFPFLDCAYQGFAIGDIDVDAAPVRLFDDDSRYPFAVAQSFAKNFGLYGERIGLLSFVSSDAEEAERVLSQVKIIIRSMYSNPPLFGARVVATILNNPTLFHQWKGEVKGLSKRLQDVRSELHRVLTKLSEDLADPKALQWDTILQQTGMFSYTGLTPEEVDELEYTYGIFMTRDGRISLAGLNSSNVQYVAESIHKVAAKRFQD